MSRFVKQLALAGVLMLAATGVHAQEFNAGPGPENKLSAGLLLGYGIGFDEDNWWGFGLGARAGYNLNQIYLGLRFMYHFGETNEGLLGLGERTTNLWEIGAEGGYDFLVVDKLTVRPELGLGVAVRTEDLDVDFGSTSETNANMYMAFGASLLYDVSPTFFLGLDTRIQLVFGDGSPAALVLLLNPGLRF